MSATLFAHAFWAVGFTYPLEYRTSPVANSVRFSANRSELLEPKEASPKFSPAKRVKQQLERQRMKRQISSAILVAVVAAFFHVPAALVAQQATTSLKRRCYRFQWSRVAEYVREHHARVRQAKL